MPNFTVVVLNCGLTAPKSRQKWNFWYKFSSNGKFWGSTEKVEYRCTTTNLHVCHDTIIVLKITPWQTDRQNKHHTFSSTAGEWPTIPTIFGMVIEEVCTIFAIWEFRKIVQTSDPRGVNLWLKFEILTVLGLYSHISAPINVQFGTGLPV